MTSDPGTCPIARLTGKEVIASSVFSFEQTKIYREADKAPEGNLEKPAMAEDSSFCSEGMLCEPEPERVTQKRAKESSR
jgi:hypothetical protein